MGVRINGIMQTCFFALSGILPREEAIAAIKKAIQKTYGKKGEAVVQKNYAAVDATLEDLHEVTVPGKVTSGFDLLAPVPNEAPEDVKKIAGPIIALEGDSIPVSAFAPDGTFPHRHHPVGEAQRGSRSSRLGSQRLHPVRQVLPGLPSWGYPGQGLRRGHFSRMLRRPSSPPTPSGSSSQARNLPSRWQWKTAPGCGLCVVNCPAKNKTEEGKKAINMVPQPPLRDEEKKNWEFFLDIPDAARGDLNLNAVKDVQLLRPLFEFSGACAGCGETPYVKLLSTPLRRPGSYRQRHGMLLHLRRQPPHHPLGGGITRVMALPGPNSLFEDNAEFGMGMRLAADKNEEFARELVVRLKDAIGEQLVKALLETDQSNDEGIATQRKNVEEPSQGSRQLQGSGCQGSSRRGRLPH